MKNLPDSNNYRFNKAWWEAEISAAVNIPDPADSNRKITFDHYRLSIVLHELTGVNAGANFHTWAVWGSRKAGETIRLEDTKPVRRLITVISLLLAALIAVAAFFTHSTAFFGSFLAFAAILCFIPLLLQKILKKSAVHILEGNRTVLDDIGRVTAGFAETFYNQSEPDEKRLEEFLGSLRSGRAENGGQALLQRAFTNYYLARYERETDKKHEYMLLGNCYAILHEHYRLEPYIRAAMPRLLRRLITRHLLVFSIGSESLSVGRDVPAHQANIFPPTLKELNNPELLAFLYGDGWDRTPESLLGSQAEDWSVLQNRMNYIVDLFRSRHFHPELFNFPFKS